MPPLSNKGKAPAMGYKAMSKTNVRPRSNPKRPPTPRPPKKKK